MSNTREHICTKELVSVKVEVCRDFLGHLTGKKKTVLLWRCIHCDEFTQSELQGEWPVESFQKYIGKQLRS